MVYIKRIFKITKQIEIPEPPKKPDGSIDSSFQLKYYREHFFDNFDLADDALIRMPRPFYQEKLKDYDAMYLKFLERRATFAPQREIKLVW